MVPKLSAFTKDSVSGPPLLPKSPGSVGDSLDTVESHRSSKLPKQRTPSLSELYSAASRSMPGCFLSRT